MITRVLTFLALTTCLVSCSVDTNLSDAELELCIALVCDPHKPCQIVLSTEACYSDGPSLCETKQCAEGTECRFGSCTVPNLDGEVCEEDSSCLRDEICVLGYCTAIENSLEGLL